MIHPAPGSPSLLFATGINGLGARGVRGLVTMFGEFAFRNGDFLLRFFLQREM